MKCKKDAILVNTPTLLEETALEQVFGADGGDGGSAAPDVEVAISPTVNISSDFVLEPSWIAQRLQDLSVGALQLPKSEPKGETEPTISLFGRSFFLTDRRNADVFFKHEDLSDHNLYPVVADKLRSKTGKYWTSRYPDDRQYIIFFEDIAPARRFIPVKMRFLPFGTSVKENTSTLSSTREWALLEANTVHYQEESYGESIDPGYTPSVSTTVFSPKKFSDAIKGGSIDQRAPTPPMVRLNEWFYDHTYLSNSAYKKEELSKVDTHVLSSHADIRGYYNFYVREYEFALLTNNVPEQVLPNMYVFFADKKSQKTNVAYKELITLNGSISDDVTKAMFLQYDGIQTGELVADYFKKYAKKYPSSTIDLAQRFSNIAFPVGDIELLTDYQERKVMFPMYVDIEFSTDVSTEFAQILKDTELSSMLEADFMNTVINDEFDRLDSLTAKNGSFAFRRTNTFDLNDWLGGFLNSQNSSASGTNAFDGFDFENSIFIGSYANEKKADGGDRYALWRSLMSLIFAGKIRQLVDKHFRTYEEMMSGKEAYSETVLYRVAKYKGRSRKGKSPIQNFYFPNSNELSVLNFIDTQVKYNGDYTYVVYAYDLVIGTKYQYLNVVSDPQFGKYAAVEVQQEPSLKLIESVYYERTLRLVDDPPIMPDVELVPYRAVNDKIKIQLRGNVGKYTLMPETIEAVEDDMITMFRLAQGVESDEPIQYKSDDHPAFFDIYRLEEHPSNYADFAGNLRKRVSTEVNDKHPMRATSAAYIDKLVPNKKYYYTFRSIDNHGHVSYPSPVFQYEIVDDAGATYSLISVVEFIDETERVPLRTMKRYVEIKPAFAQTLLEVGDMSFEDFQAEVNNGNVKLGSLEESVWGRRFKIRLTSKNTGKKVDLNIQFDHKFENRGESE